MVAAEQVTQQKGAIAGVQIASKTGTAEHGTDPRNTPPHAWYIAFAPAQAPKVAVAVLVENGGDRLSATGGALAAPIGRATIAAALREGHEPRDDASEDRSGPRGPERAGVEP